MTADAVSKGSAGVVFPSRPLAIDPPPEMGEAKSLIL
jgi:hypothetical protein